MAEERPFEPITTQEQLDAVVRDRVCRAREKAVEPYADYDELKARAEAAERAAGEVDELRRRADEAEGALARAKEERERDAARAKVSEETGVPASLIAGDDEGAMRESAAALAAWGRPRSRSSADGGTSMTAATASLSLKDWSNVTTSDACSSSHGSTFRATVTTSPASAGAPWSGRRRTSSRGRGRGRRGSAV